eukprot:CAMPEP_0175128636 /NCGR_PEP_ID=MMETSP0087-20121206/5039_1 /TAXON_ID=136419 /ORGANISM="Unknown Unknown, Strain D1" /LENGTH=220 /DNA_ID=CAMNT_0016410721 /DNA_START=147 /DNA_END=807 /DNA_ORIENTATION=-
MVKYMFRALDRMGCKVDPWHFVSCVPCEDQVVGAMSSNEDGDVEVLMCQNHVKNQKNFNTVLTHELIHVFDTCRAHVDFTDCRHLACSEVRAANLSGDCWLSAELRRGNFGAYAHHQKCVKRRALMSVKYNPWCQGEGVAEHAVNDVFRQCMKDTAPFYAVPDSIGSNWVCFIYSNFSALREVVSNSTASRTKIEVVDNPRRNSKKLESIGGDLAPSQDL